MTNTSDDQTLTIPDSVETDGEMVDVAPVSEVTAEVPAEEPMAEPAAEEAPGEETEAKDSTDMAEVDAEAHDADHQPVMEDEELKKQSAAERAMRLITAIERDMRELRSLITGHEISYGAIPGAGPKTKAYVGEESVATPSGFMTRNQSRGDEGIEGTFDGERMIDTNGKTYPVPPNYASKSKLVEGDPLKLYITPDGKFVFKQLGPIQRRSYTGTLIQDGSHYIVHTDEDMTFNILTACVTYHMALYGLVPGARVQILVPADRETRWAVIDAVI